MCPPSQSKQEVRLPRYLQHDTVDALYASLNRVQDDVLRLSFSDCVWADHFELHRLAVFLATLIQQLSKIEIEISITNPDPNNVPQSRSRHVDVIQYATQMGFFSFLSEYANGKLAIVIDGNHQQLLEPHNANQIIERLLPISSYGAHNLESVVPLRSIRDHTSVEATSNVFSTSESVRNSLNYYTELDYVTSGQLAILIVHELLQNIAEHASTNKPWAAGVSLSIVSFRKKREQFDRYAARLKYAPEYEREFIRKTGTPGYVELAVVDSGVGIVESLSSCPHIWDLWFDGRREKPSALELLAASFWSNVTRDPGPHRPGYRGLYWVADSIRENHGLLYCHTADTRCIFSPNSTSTHMHGTGSLKPIPLADFQTTTKSWQGTEFRILLPLSSTKKRSHWRLDLSSPIKAATDVTKTIVAPDVVGVPPAPRAENLPDNQQLAMHSFREECAKLFGVQPGTLPRYWISACKGREWKKAHIQTLLDEIIKLPSSSVVFIVNIPSHHFYTFNLIARHFVAIEQGRVVMLVDDSGRRLLVYRDTRNLYEEFMQWSRTGGFFSSDGTPPGDLLESIAFECGRDLAPLTLNDLLFLSMRRGIDVEYKNIIDEYRYKSGPVRIGTDYAVDGFVELDEAIREPDFARSLSSCIEIAIRSAIRPDGTIVVRRPARRLVEFRGPIDRRDYWFMHSIEPEHLPTIDWLTGKKIICLVTDVVCRGVNLLKLTKAIYERAGNESGIHFIVIAPLLVQPPDAEPANEGYLVECSPIPMLARLRSSDGFIPLVWILRTEARTFAVGDDFATLPTPEAQTNIVLDAVSRNKHEIRNIKPHKISVTDFIRSAERHQAILLDHVTITGEHFDLEFDMTRLLSESSTLMREFSEAVAQTVKDRLIDVVVYPDESRIQIAIPSIIDTINRIGTPVPTWVRLRRGTDGQFFGRVGDNQTMRKCRHVLLLDDAVNSGGTVREMLAVLNRAGSRPETTMFYCLISRQNRSQQNFLASVTEISDTKFDADCFIHFPVLFYSPTSCPFCRKQQIARAHSISGGGRLPLALAMSQLADSLNPHDVYYESGPFHSQASSPRSCIAPVFASGDVHSDYFATLSGAKAAIAASVAEITQYSSDIWNRLFDVVSNDPQLSSYLLYALSSRSLSPEVLWSDETFCKIYENACIRVGRSDDPQEDALVDLCRAAWFAPSPRLLYALTTLIRSCSSGLRYDSFFNNVLLLFLQHLENAFVLRSSETYKAQVDDLRTTIVNAQKELTGNEYRNVQRLDMVDMMMRLGHLSQLLSDDVIEDRWLQGIPHLLKLLSYIAGHMGIQLVTPAQRTHVLRLRNQVRRMQGEAKPEIFIRPEVSRPVVWDRVKRILSCERGDLSSIATRMLPTMHLWFRALQHANELKISFAEARSMLDAVQEQAQRLLSIVDDLSLIYRHRNLDQLDPKLGELARAQENLYELLYVKKSPGPITLRALIENYLCPIPDLAQDLTRESVRQAYQASLHKVEVTGTFFDYADKISENRDGHGDVKWRVVLGPESLAVGVLENIICTNPLKHVAQQLPKQSTLRINVDLDGLVDLSDHIAIRTEVFVNGRPWPFQKAPFNKTLGSQKTLLKLYGGDLRLESNRDDPGSNSVVIAEFRAGHF